MGPRPFYVGMEMEEESVMDSMMNAPCCGSALY